MVLDDLRNYLQMASGLTEATASKAKEVVTGLVSTGMSLSTKAMPAPEMMGQVQELADDLVATSRNNREMLVGMIRAEVDRAVGRMGFVREDELAALRRHVQRLEAQLNGLQMAAERPPQTYPATPEPTPEPKPEPKPEPAPEPAPPVAAAADDPPAPPEETVHDAATEPAPKKKKKRTVVDEGA